MGRLFLYLRQNVLVLLLAFAMSWLVWVQLSTVFVETWRGEVPVRRLSENQIMVLEGGPPTIVVEVRGNRREIDQLRAGLTADIRLRNEFLDPAQASQSRTFTVDDLELPGEVEVLAMEPASFEVRFAKLARSPVPVTAKDRLDATKIEDFEILDPLVVPGKVVVEGPEKLVAGLTTIEVRKIDLADHVARMRAAAARGEFEIIVTSAPEELEAKDIRFITREVNVLVRFRELHRRMVWVPLEAHWVDPDHEKPVGFRFKSTASPRSVVEKRLGRWMVKVTLKGPKDTITLLIPEARRAEEVPVVETVRAYVRSDDALPSIEQGAGAIGPILVQGLPEGVSCEKIDPLPDGEVVEVK